MKEPKIGIIILAGGASKRLGSPKQLLEFAGETLLEKIARTAIATKFHTVIVLGSNANEIRRVIPKLPIEIIVNDGWQSGIASSIKAGLAKLTEIHDDLSAVILLLCDQPFITTETLVNLANAYSESGKPIVASAYEDTIGTPALFAREMFNDLNKLKGEQGAKPLIRLHQETAVKTIAAPEAGFDVDSLKDFKRLSRKD